MPVISSRYAIVMDFESGRILYEKNGFSVVPMASTTKIMTAVVALENSNINDIVTISKRAASIGGSTIGLKSGQRLTMEQLLYGLMLRSGNDCAIAIAEHIGGSVESFARMMNSKAFNIGAYNTSFRTPHGLDAEGHFTTVYDLALITRYALSNSDFAKIVSTKDIAFEGIGGNIKFHNINKILWSLEGADGVKTGYTGKAGRCLVSSASRDGRRLICVTLNSPKRWDDSKRLIEYGFSNYQNILTIESRSYDRYIFASRGRRCRVYIEPDAILKIPVTKEEKNNLQISVELPQTLESPIYKGQQVGKLVIYHDNEVLFSIPYRSSENID